MECPHHHSYTVVGNKYLIQSSHRKSSEIRSREVEDKKRVDFFVPCVKIFPHSSQFMYSVHRVHMLYTLNEYTSCGRQYIAIQKDVTEITTVPGGI